MKKLLLSSLGTGNLKLVDGSDNFHEEVSQELTESPFWTSVPAVCTYTRFCSFSTEEGGPLNARPHSLI